MQTMLKARSVGRYEGIADVRPITHVTLTLDRATSRARIMRRVGAHRGIQMRSISRVPVVVHAHRRLCPAVSHTRGRKSDKSIARAI